MHGRTLVLFILTRYLWLFSENTSKYNLFCTCFRLYPRYSLINPFKYVNVCTYHTSGFPVWWCGNWVKYMYWSWNKPPFSIDIFQKYRLRHCKAYYNTCNTYSYYKIKTKEAFIYYNIKIVWTSITFDQIMKIYLRYQMVCVKIYNFNNQFKNRIFNFLIEKKFSIIY